MSISDRMRTWRVAVVEPHLFQRERVVEVIDGMWKTKVVRVADSFRELVGWLRSVHQTTWPHLILLDLRPTASFESDIALMAALREAGVRIVLLTGATTPKAIHRAAAAGADALMSKREGGAGAHRGALGGEGEQRPRLIR